MSRVKTGEPSGATLISVFPAGPVVRCRAFQAGDRFHPAISQSDLQAAAGVVVWPMAEFEADDALAAAAVVAARDAGVERVIICTPDKDLAQCVWGTRVVQLNRRTRFTLDERGVIQKFGVSPESIPDYLALVGDSADGYPGLRGWGAKSSAAILAKFIHLESIPADWREWHMNAAHASALANTLNRELDRALLFRTLATLRTDIPLFEDVDQLRWNGPHPLSTRSLHDWTLQERSPAEYLFAAAERTMMEF